MFKLRKPEKEDWDRLCEKTSRLFSKPKTRNWMIVLSVLLIGGAVYLNFVLFGPQNDLPGGDVNASLSDPKDLTGDTAVTGSKDGISGSTGNADDAYFASAQISRSRARDEAMEVLRLVIDNAETAPGAKEEAMSEMNRMAAAMEAEAKIETLVKSKGFESCVAVISGSGCSVIVSSDGLLPSELVQIQEIVYEQAGILPAQLRIIEKA